VAIGVEFAGASDASDGSAAGEEPTSKRPRANTPDAALRAGVASEAQVLAGLTRLRAMHPGRPWEVDLDQSARVKKAGGQPVWWWKDIHVRGRFVQYPMEAQDVVEAAYQKLALSNRSGRALTLGGGTLGGGLLEQAQALGRSSSGGGASANGREGGDSTGSATQRARCEYTTSSGKLLKIEVALDGTGSHTIPRLAHGRRAIKRTFEVAPDWTCAQCSLQNRGGTTCISCQWDVERLMVDPTAPTSPR
jgi:hypothetical protein